MLSLTIFILPPFLDQVKSAATFLKLVVMVTQTIATPVSTIMFALATLLALCSVPLTAQNCPLREGKRDVHVQVSPHAF